MIEILQKDSTGKWNTTPPVPEDEINNVNCHRFVLYITGRMSFEEMIADSKVQRDSGKEFIFADAAQSISDQSFTQPMKGLDVVKTFADTECDTGRVFIGQILDPETETLAHSFIVERNGNRSYTCYDKPGFKYPFRVCSLDDIFNFINKDGEPSYVNMRWRFIHMQK